MTLSIAVAAKGVCDPGAFLESLVRQGVYASADVDVHIAHDEAWPVEYRELDTCITLHRCASGTSVLRLWGKAIAESQGEYVAVLDIRGPLEKGWLRCVEQQVQNRVPLFFGPVEPGWDRDDPRITGYLAEYVQFSRPLSRDLNEVPGNNVVFLRSLLDDKARLLSEGFFKTFMVWRLEQDLKLKPQMFDDMVVIYYKPFSYGHYLRRRYAHGQCFGATRHDNAGQPARAICMMATLVLPLIRLGRIYRAVRRRPDLHAAFFRHLHLLVQSEVAWSLGELAGYINRNRTVCAQLD